MPQFEAGSVYTAKAVMLNPTSGAFDYLGVLFMGVDQASMAEVNFHLNAGESKEVSFSVTMPPIAGEYPVYIGVFSGGVFIEPLRQGENVTIISTPLNEWAQQGYNAEIHLANGQWSELAMDLIMHPSYRSIDQWSSQALIPYGFTSTGIGSDVIRYATTPSGIGSRVDLYDMIRWILYNKVYDCNDVPCCSEGMNQLSISYWVGNLYYFESKREESAEYEAKYQTALAVYNWFWPTVGSDSGVEAEIWRQILMMQSGVSFSW